MKVIQIYMNNALRNFNYIVYSDKSKEAIFIDPLDVSKTLKVAENLGLKPTYLINTHHHQDHTHDNKKFLNLTGATYLKLENEQKFFLSDEEYIQALDTPGHVMDHQCFLVGDKKVKALISGDALFNAGVGNCKNGGDVTTHFNSIYNIIRNLPEHIKIYPAHDYLLNNLEFALTIDEDNLKIKELISLRKNQNVNKEFIVTDLKTEKEINPFLRLESESLIKKFPQCRSNKDRFITIRHLRDNW